MNTYKREERTAEQIWADLQKALDRKYNGQRNRNPNQKEINKKRVLAHYKEQLLKLFN
jgi:hypothetical protein